MKLSVLTGLILVFVYSCSEIEKDCMCTQEFRGYAVVVTDTLGVPADSLSVTIKDQNGNILDVEQEQFDPEDGKYTVLTDSFTQLFCTCETPGKIYFSATDGNRTAYGEFMFNTDECKCHINKVSGPDTLIIR